MHEYNCWAIDNTAFLIDGQSASTRSTGRQAEWIRLDPEQFVTTVIPKSIEDREFDPVIFEHWVNVVYILVR